ncbi:MAG TPA: DUF1326 domain-containing protein [Euzebya sp.]|nr:DUF1326 domain-containing protein [Euzebya sp.]
MTDTLTRAEGAHAIYQVEGTLLEACSCGVLCPCWVGADPDGGSCYGMNAYHIDSGQVGGVDVSGMNFITINLIPGNILQPASWKCVHLIDERGTAEQQDAVLGLFRGAYGGPLADLFTLTGEVLGTEVVTIEHEVSRGAGSLVVPGIITSAMEPFRGPDGTVTTLRDSLFSTVPGSPAWAARASIYHVELPKYGLSWHYEGHNAIQAEWKLEFSG